MASFAAAARSHVLAHRLITAAVIGLTLLGLASIGSWLILSRGAEVSTTTLPAPIERVVDKAAEVVQPKDDGAKANPAPDAVAAPQRQYEDWEINAMGARHPEP